MCVECSVINGIVIQSWSIHEEVATDEVNKFESPIVSCGKLLLADTVVSVHQGTWEADRP